MNFIKRLLRSPASLTHPAEQWEAIKPDEAAQGLRIGYQLMSFGPVTFGDSSVKASSLGKPSEIESISAHGVRLSYPHFLLEFEHDRLAYVAVIVEPVSPQADVEGHSLPAPNIFGLAPLPITLGSQHSQKTIGELFGQSRSIDSDEHETILNYQNGSVSMEFEFSTQTDQLRRWNIFLK